MTVTCTNPECAKRYESPSEAHTDDPERLCFECFSKACELPKGMVGCGCCGRLMTDNGTFWCPDCKGHVLPWSHNTNPEDRTWSAQYHTDCPFQETR